MYATDRTAARRELASLLDALIDVLVGRAEIGTALRELRWSFVPVELEHEQAFATVFREFARLRQAALGWLEDQGQEVAAGALATFAEVFDRSTEAALSTHLSLQRRILQGMDRIAHTRYRDRRIEEVLASLGEIILDMGTADTVILFLLEGDRLRVRASLGAGSEVATSLAPAVGEGFVGDVAAARAPRRLDALDPDTLARCGLPGLGVSSIYGVPLLADTELVGVALLGSNRTLSDGDRLLFRWMASRAGLMVESVLTDARGRAVGAIMRALAAASTLPTGARNLLEEVGSTLAWDVGVFWTAQDGRLRYLAGWAAEPGFEHFLAQSRDISFAPGDHLPGEAWTSDRAEWISDIARDPAFSRGATARRVGLRSGVALALRSPDELLGVLEFFSRHLRSPAEAGLQVTEIVAPQVSEFLQRVRAADEIRRGREQAAEAARRQKLMADGSRALSEASGIREGLLELTRLVTRDFATWCTVELLEDERLERIAATHRDGAHAGEIDRGPRATRRSDLGERSRAALTAGPPVRAGRGTDGARADEDSVLHLPLRAGDRVIGALRMGRGPDLPPFRDDELDLASDLAGRAAVMLENRLLYLKVDAARRRLETVLAQLPAGVLLADAEGRLELGNDAARPYIEHLPSPPPPDLPMLRALRGETVTQEEFTVEIDGEQRVLLTNAAPIDAGGDARDGAVVAFVDITDRKRSEEELAQTAVFREQFLGVVSHDLKNPLTAIRMAAGLLARQRLEPNQRAIADRIRTSAERMTHMIEDLLDFTRGRLGGGIPVSLGEADLHEIVRSTVDEMRVATPEVPIEMRFEGEPRGRWDPTRIAQLVSNLLGNAVRYRAPGTPVRVAVGGDEAFVWLEVQNEGPLIPSEDLPHLFDPFRRDAHSEGLGLGLYIVEQITRAHGGEIDVRSQAPEGTVFRVRLPRRPPR